MLTLTLPIPPSVNAAFLNRKSGRGKGRIKSAKYRAWLKNADAHFLYQKQAYRQEGLQITPVQGPYICGMIFPRKLRGDLDNRVKLILDWMVSRELTSDDRYLMSYHPVRGDTPDGYVTVQVKEDSYAGSFVSGTATLSTGS